MTLLQSSRRLLRSLLVTACLAWGFAPGADAFDEFSYDLRLIRALADNNLADYAIIQVERMLRQYPDRRDIIELNRAHVYYSQNRRTQAEQIINAIGADSPLFGPSRLIKGETAFRRGDFETAAQALGEYFSTDPKPAAASRRAAEGYLETVFTYAQCLVEMGDPLGTIRAVGNAETVTGEFALAEEQLDFQRGRLGLAACNKALALGKPIGKEIVARIISRLEEIQFKQVDYLLMINSLVEAAHGQVIMGDIDVVASERLSGNPKNATLTSALGHYDKSLETLRSLSELLGAVKGQVPPKDSPVAGALYQYGRARAGQARAAHGKGDTERAVRLLNAAGKYFNQVREEYAQSAFGTPAIVEFGRAAEWAAVIDPGLQIVRRIDPASPLLATGGRGEGSAMASIEMADRYFSAKDYEQAAPLYLTALQNARLSPRLAPPTGLKLVVCYGQLGNMLEAQALASYLADVFPNATETADALLQLGSIPFAQAKDEQNPERKDALLDEAMLAWDQFVDVAPDHRSAAEIAFVVAENVYRKASVVANQSQRAGDRQRSEQLKQQAREIFRAAIPAYERVISLYGGSRQGARALYKLAWVYHSLDEAEAAAENFLAYSVREQLPEYAEDRLEAKFRAGEQLMFSEAPARAIPVFEDLLKWIAPGNPKGFDPNSPRAVRAKEDTTSYIAWTYDLAGEAIRPQITAINDERNAQQQAIKEAETGLVRLAAEEEELNTWLENLGRQTDALKADFSQPLPRPEERALAEFLPQEEVSGWSDAERAVELPRRREQASRLAADYRNQSIQSMQGLKEELDGQRDAAFQRLRLANSELEEAKANRSARMTHLREMQDELIYLTSESDHLAGEYEAAKNELAEAERVVEELRERYDQARAQFLAGNETERTAAREELEEVRALAPGARNRRMQASNRVDELETDAPRLARRRAVRERDLAQGKVETLERQLAEMRRREALLAADITFAEVRLKTLTRAIEMADRFIALMKTPEANRYAEENVRSYREPANQLLALFDEVVEAAENKRQTAVDFIAADRKAYEISAEEAKKRIAELAEEIKPLQAEFERLKKRAQEAFTAFLEQYPDSRHAPDNMARVGTIFLEFEEYAKAERYLNELAAKFPDHDAVRQAMFNLGRVQIEIGKVDEGAAAFRRVLETANEQAAANLGYIVRATLDTDDAELALIASRELLARSEDINHADYEDLSGRARENILFRAGRSAMQAGQHQAAAAYFDTLLKENERSARFFEANLLKGRAYRLMQPPKTDEARRALDQVRRFAQDNATLNQALVELAEVYIAEDSREGVLRALTQLGQIVIVADGQLEVLADDRDPDSRPLIDKAFFLAAQCYAWLGDDASRDLIVEEYRRRFPAGDYRQQIGNLPAPKFN